LLVLLVPAERCEGQVAREQKEAFVIAWQGRAVLECSSSWQIGLTLS